MSQDHNIAQTILDGFNKHYRLFRQASTQAADRFAHSDWQAALAANKERIQMYDQRVREAVDQLLENFPDAQQDALWPKIKTTYIGLLYEHCQPELAETFFNSVACRVLDRSYYHNANIFWRPAISTEHIEGTEPIYRSFYPDSETLTTLFSDILTGLRLKNDFQDIDRDVHNLIRAFADCSISGKKHHPNFQIQLLPSPFYRNKAAYVVGRIIDGNTQQPFVFVLLKNSDAKVYVDALLTREDQISTLFSFARAYFMVDMEVPSAYVQFLQSLLPNRAPAEIYTILGLQKHGKTLFYRELHHHLKHSTDDFCIAAGIKGMVMLVFTLPSFPFVFKIIRDRFPPPKDMSRLAVKGKYLLVKYHDRVGRLADTLEYSQVALPRSRFSDALIAELRDEAATSVEVDDDRVLIKHVYIERRMIPLNVFLKDAIGEERDDAIRDYGNAIRDLTGANIFPGDMLLKNFGVTRTGRIVFYDYDEIRYMTECNFRKIPPASSWEDDILSEAYFSIEANDVFPEQFDSYFFSDEDAKALFEKDHKELADVTYWQTIQQRIRDGIQADVFPYPEELRFSRRFSKDDS